MVIVFINFFFRSCHAIAKHSRPYSDLVWMSELDEIKGVDIGMTYRNDKQAKIFINMIAEVERKHLADLVQNAKFISLISDGTTDMSITEAEIVYVRFANEGTVTSQFVAIQNLPKADAQAISKAIIEAIQIYIDVDDWEKKLVGFGSDGAAVMLGKKSGVAALLKKQQPCLQAVHCCAHRLELAYKDALKSVNLYTTLSQLLLNLYLFYHNSPLNRSNLKISCDALGLPQTIPSRVGGTRWLPHLHASLQKFLRGYTAIVTHLGQVISNCVIFTFS